MSIIKSFSVKDTNGEQGDMFYIKHGSSNFTIIDCCLNDDTKSKILGEIIVQEKGKNITRVISTHPDEDHISGLEFLDEEIDIKNFYCVKNSATKKEESNSFKHYCKLRDNDKKSFYVERGCKRKWINDCNKNDPDDSGSSGINFLWPIMNNSDFKDELQKAKDGKEFNNISPIFTYTLEKSICALWMGDLETNFVEKIKSQITWPEVDVVFAPHHGRESGTIPSDVLEKLNPQVIIIGEAPSEHINYYSKYNTIKQNSAKDIVFECESGKVHIYVSNNNYCEDFLNLENHYDDSLGHYIGSFNTKEQ